MNDQDKRLTFWGMAICRHEERWWAVAQVYNNGGPSESFWLAPHYDQEEGYEPKWLTYPDGRPTLFTKDEIDEFVEGCLYQ